MTMKTNVFNKQIIEFNKTAFDTTFKAMVMLQDQLEAMTAMALDQSVGIPEEGKKAIDEWVKNYKKGRDEFKRAVDEGFRMLESLLG